MTLPQRGDRQTAIYRAVSLPLGKLEFGGVRRSTNAFPFGEGASEGGGRGVILQRKITLPKAINRYVVAENAN